MLKNILLCLSFLQALTLNAQIGFSANDLVPPYDKGFRYGSNLGNYPPWSNEQLADIAAGNPDLGLEGIGVQSFRPAIQEHFLEQWGYDIRQPDFQHWYNRGVYDNVAFIGYPSADHRDPTVYCGTEPSELFENMYEPIWDNGANGTPVNENNYYALYVYKMVWEYAQFIKFWEVWNEPDLTAAAAAWLPPNDPNSWWQTDPSPCDLDFHAPIQHYIRMLRISYEVIKFVDEDAYVAIGGIGVPSFLDAVLRNTDNPIDGSVTAEFPLKGGAYFDVLSFHAYPHIDGSMWEFPPTGGLVFHRHSDRGVDGFINKYESLRDVLWTHGYEGQTFPKKLAICTETMLPRKAFNNYIGSEEAQVNYLLKSLVESQRLGLLQTDVFTISELSTEPNAWNEYLLMGLFENLEQFAPYDFELTAAGVAFHTLTNILSGKPYSKIKTDQLNLPDNIRGAAFADSDGGNIFVLWAKTTTDQSETANATWSFPPDFGFNEVTVWQWDFTETGQAEVISSQNIPLTGTPVFIKAGTHINAPPTAQFSATPLTGCAPLIVQFNDLSGGNPTQWNWQFPGANQTSSNIQNPIIVYGEAGQYDVTLTAGNAFGENTITHSGLIVVEAEPVADFNFSVNNYAVTFTNLSSGGINYAWDFGDNETSDELNPTHVYAQNGTYTVSLTVENDCGTHTYTQDILIDVMTGTSDFGGDRNFLEVYPNPTSGVVQIRISGEGVPPSNLMIFNILGQKIKTASLKMSGDHAFGTFNLSGFSPGIYWVVSESGGQILRKKIILTGPSD
ncbi:MAG: PKD domain-containing protein [Bacteroidetes bacterium]|nr:MAG: PKD domain-containing protein [Bacteroidota bacterium]